VADQKSWRRESERRDWITT